MGLRWGDSYLADVAFHCLGNIKRNPSLADLLLDLDVFLDKRSGAELDYTWASGCSGTDSPRWGYNAIKQALVRFGFPSHFTTFHAASAERDQTKREFIKRLVKPRRLVKDVFELSGRVALDVLSTHHGVQFFPSAELSDLDVFLIGFVCKSVSFLNTNKDAAQVAAWNADSLTGSTLRAAILFLERMKPRAAILENVMGLLVNSQHLYVVSLLERAGYTVVLIFATPIEVGIPHDRPRL
jgi:site-specific DNA-cytosine methylase